MFSVILVNNSQEDADEYVHANNDIDHEEYAIPIAYVVCWNPAMNYKLWHYSKRF